MGEIKSMNKYIVVKYYKGKIFGDKHLGPYETEDKANDVCSKMNNSIGKISKFVNFKVKTI